MMLGNHRGESKVGCVVVTLVLAVSIFLTYKIGPVYFDKVSFEDEVTRIVNRAGAENWKDQTIQGQILSTARSMGFEISRDKIRIDRFGRFQSASRLKVIITFGRLVEFPGYEHFFQFNSEFTALIGRL
jgi:hypothetical protein